MVLRQEISHRIHATTLFAHSAACVTCVLLKTHILKHYRVRALAHSFPPHMPTFPIFPFADFMWNNFNQRAVWPERTPQTVATSSCLPSVVTWPYRWPATSYLRDNICRCCVFEMNLLRHHSAATGGFAMDVAWHITRPTHLTMLAIACVLQSASLAQGLRAATDWSAENANFNLVYSKAAKFNSQSTTITNKHDKSLM